MVQREVVTNAGEHLTCHSRNGNHRILHSHQDGILHNLHIRSRARPQPHACRRSPCCSRIHHSLCIHGILRILRIQSRARQQPWAQPHACRSIPCRVLHSRSCGIHQDRIHHIRSRAQPQPHACHSSPCCSRIHHSLHSHGILRILHIQSRARQQPWVRPQPHVCRSIPCRVLHSRSCGIHQDRIHHIQSRAQPRPHACHRNPCRVLHSRSCGIHHIQSRAQPRPHACHRNPCCSQGCIHHIHGIR